MTQNINIRVLDMFLCLAKDLDLDSYTVNYCCTRFKNEGIQFFTKTLPKIGKTVVRSIELGFFDRSTLTDFAWKGGSLRIFRSLLSRVFDTKSGLLLPDPCVVSIWTLRQVSEYMYKLALEFTHEEVERSEELYIENEESMNAATLIPEFVESMRKNIETNYRFPKDYSAVLGSCRPRYGPGSFSFDMGGNLPSISQKDLPWYAYKVHPDTTWGVPFAYRPYSGYFKPYPSAPKNRITFRGDTACKSTIRLVPKDSRGPRVISMEPLYQLKLQMAYFDYFSSFFERCTLHRVNFQDQQVNRELARLGSIDGSYSTFDLKDASDRLQAELAWRLFRNIPSVSFFLRRRSTQVELPSGKVISIKKLAGMGSGLTFATMAFVIHVAVATMISQRTNLTYWQASQNVYVYGDDLIVPQHFSRFVIPALEAIGMKVNHSKSFFCVGYGQRGYFRESCGGDYFAGNNVAPTRFTASSSKPKYSEGFITLSGSGSLLQVDRHARELFKNGMPLLADYYWNIVERSTGKLPVVGGESCAIGRWRYNAISNYSPDSYGHYPLVKCVVPVTPEFEADVDPYYTLSRCLKAKRSSTSTISATSVPVPRDVRYLRKKVSSITFMESDGVDVMDLIGR